MTIEPDAAPAPAPRAVSASFWLHVVGAVLGLLGAVVLLVALPTAIDQAVEATRRIAEGRDTGGVDVRAVATGTAIATAAISVAMTVVFSVLTLVFAVRMRRGRNWARIVLAVFAGLQLFGVLGAYGVGALHAVVVVVAAVLSFLPSSNEWFRTRPRARPTA